MTVSSRPGRRVLIQDGGMAWLRLPRTARC